MLHPLKSTRGCLDYLRKGLEAKKNYHAPVFIYYEVVTFQILLCDVKSLLCPSGDKLSFEEVAGTPRASQLPITLIKKDLIFVNSIYCFTNRSLFV